MNEKCIKYTALIPDYIDGSLPADKKSELEEHFAQCDNCRREIDKQRKWLASSFVTQNEADLLPEEQERLHSKIMETIRSNEQSHRAAAYINDYKSKNDMTEDSIATQSDKEPDKMVDKINRRKNRKIWRSLPVITGYAAMIVLVIVVVIMVRDLDGYDNSELISDRVDIEMDMGGDENANLMTEAVDGDFAIDSITDDSATLPMIETNFADIAVDDTASEDVENQEEFDGEDSLQYQTEDGIWRIYSGRLGELPLNPDLFSESEAFDAKGVFHSSKALRILVQESIENTNQIENTQESSDMEDQETQTTQSQTTANPSNTVINSVLILTAWNSWDIENAAENLKYQLEKEESTDYNIIILDDSAGINQIESMIGSKETSAWREQIMEQELDELIWLAFISK